MTSLGAAIGGISKPLMVAPFVGAALSITPGLCIAVIEIPD
jgi:hypothetical protein